MNDLCRLYATLQNFAWKKKIADPIPKTYRGRAMSELRKLYTVLKSLVWKKESTETERIPVPCIALLMKQILRIAQEKIIVNATKIDPSNDPEEILLQKEKEKEKEFLALARECAWYSTKFDTMCSLAINHSLSVLTLGIVPVVASFIAAGLRRQTYEKRRDTTEKFIQIFTGCKPSELSGTAPSGIPTCKDTSYFIHSADSEFRAMMRDEPEFVPNEKFFYRFKSDLGYYLWKGLGAIPGLSFLKPKKVQHEESLTHAQRMLSKIDERAKKIDEKRKEREVKIEQMKDNVITSFGVKKSHNEQKSIGQMADEDVILASHHKNNHDNARYGA